MAETSAKRRTLLLALLMAGAVAVSCVIGAYYYRQNEQTSDQSEGVASTAGFDLSRVAPARPSPAPAVPAEAPEESPRPIAGLSNEDAGAPQSQPAQAAYAPPASGGNPYAQAQANAQSQPDAQPQDAPPDPSLMAATGLPTDKRGLSQLGATKGLLSKLLPKILQHPKVLRYLLNNETLVNGLFSRPRSQQNCSDTQSLKNYMTGGADPAGLQKNISIVTSVLQQPEAVAAISGTRFMDQVMQCPSVQGLMHDPGALTQMLVANPSLVGLVSNPAAVTALSSNPQAMSAIQGATAGLGQLSSH